jgi:hypothetical protein
MFNAAQVEQLLRPIHPRRVANDGKGNAHVPQQDITAHLIRVFGFGSFDVDVLNVECIFEHNRVLDDGKPSKRWDVGYRALVRLTVRDEAGNECHYDGGSTGTAQNQTLGDAHDLAYKSALSLAKKRAAINLGDQFGLSLYNKGQREALVVGTLVKPRDLTKKVAEAQPDLQHDVPQQVAEEQDDPLPLEDDAPSSPLRAALNGKQEATK